MIVGPIVPENLLSTLIISFHLTQIMCTPPEKATQTWTWCGEKHEECVHVVDQNPYHYHHSELPATTLDNFVLSEKRKFTYIQNNVDAVIT